MGLGYVGLDLRMGGMIKEKDQSIVVNVAGSYRMKFTPNHGCSKKFGFEVRIAKDLGGNSKEFDAGGVISYADIEKLYRIGVDSYENHRKNCHFKSCIHNKE